MARKNLANSLDTLFHRDGIAAGKVLELVQEYELRRRVKLYFDGHYVVSLERFSISPRKEGLGDSLQSFMAIASAEDHFCYAGLAHRVTVELCGYFQDPRIMEEWCQIVPQFVEIGLAGDASASSPVLSPRHRHLNRRSRSRSPSPDPVSPRYSSPRKMGSVRSLLLPKPSSVNVGKRVCDLEVSKGFDGNNLAHVVMFLSMIFQWWANQPVIQGIKEDRRPNRSGICQCIRLALANHEDHMGTDRAIRSCLVLYDWVSATSCIPDCTLMVLYLVEMLLYDRAAVYGANVAGIVLEHIEMCRKIPDVRARSTSITTSVNP